MSVSVCWICGKGLADRDIRRAHYASDHPGWRVTWKGRDPMVIDPAGVERVVNKSDAARMQRTAAAAAEGRTIGRPGRPKRSSATFGPPAEPGPSLAGESDAPASAAPGSAGGPTRVHQPPVHPTISAVQVSVRDAVRDSLDVKLVADLVRDLSVTISELDGAGEAGHLSATQSAMIARLIYDQTVDTIVDRFGGNVGRFKATLAVMVIVLSKGAVHARAIGAKVQGASLGRPVKPVPPPAPLPDVTEFDPEAVHSPAYYVDPNDEPMVDLSGPASFAAGSVPATDATAELAERQRAFRARISRTAG